MLVNAILINVTWIAFVCLIGCDGPTAIARRAAPIQARKNLELLRFSIQEYYNDQHHIPGMESKGSEVVMSWRIFVAKMAMGAWKGNDEELPMTEDFRIPLTCSQNAARQTNVFLVISSTQQMLFNDNSKKLWNELVNRSTDVPLLIVIDDWCVDWKSLSYILLNNIKIEDPNELGIYSIRLPESALQSPCSIVWMNGKVTRFNHVHDWLASNDENMNNAGASSR